ncbi:MAG: dockerin type I domain-containing protein [Oscillospiraceae bacterium]|nr:dockerin type I domain-containing protein [Oscillospiraceae bacterium]
MKIKRLIALKMAILCFMLVLFSTSSSDFSGPDSNLIIKGSENTGWKRAKYNYHNSSDTIQFKFDDSDPYLTTAYRNVTIQGANLWISNTALNISQSPSSTRTVKTYYNDNPNSEKGKLSAYFYYIGNPFQGHYGSWTIYINRAKNVTARTLAHEFGHAFGLGDLESPANSIKLMYHSTNNWLAQGPTTSDIWGAYAILGIHGHNISSGSWSNRFYDKTILANGKVSHTHRLACNECLAHRTTGGGNCSYNANGRCTSCNIPRNGDVDGNGARDTADADLIASIMGNHIAPSIHQYYLADTNGDGNVTVADLLELMKFLANMSSTVQ